VAESGAPIVAAESVRRSYAARAGTVHALRGVTFALWPGEIVGVVGRSGAGKSTLARLLLGLEAPDGGTVAFSGRPFATLGPGERRRMRRALQAVFQDPNASLDPRQRVGSIVGEPLAVHRLSGGARRRRRVQELLAEMGLPRDDGFLGRLPRTLSGGERQRVAIARALACDPSALVLDEPVSALDVSVRGQVLNLLVDLHRRTGIALLVIAHDVRMVARLCTRVVVLAHGEAVEEGPVGRVLSRPSRPETAELLAAARWLGGGEPGGAD
jgi:ABC-type glutathione transport system ATPase component